MRTAGLDEAQAGIKIARGNVNNLRYADETILMAESKEEPKSLLMKVKEESEKVGLKLNIRQICMQVKKQQLEQDMGQQTGSKSGKEYIKAVYCHPAYLTYMQSTS